MGTVVTTGFGNSALDTLVGVLDRGADPLAPALVVCPGPLAAVGVRRALGRRLGGVAGVDFVTLDRLAEDLSLGSLARVGQRAASTLELQAAVRAELKAQPGLFGSVAGHRTTEERLVRLASDVVGLPRDERARLRATAGLTGDSFRVLDGAARRLQPVRVPDHIIQLAVEAVEEMAERARGQIVIYLPEPARPYEHRLLASLAKRHECTVIIGLTGHDDIDRRHLKRLAACGIHTAGDDRPVEPVGARVLEVADPQDEVGAAVRELSAWAAAGTPLPQMALLYTATDPYATLIEEALEASGLPYSAPGHRPLAASLSGRTLRRLLRLAETGLERASLITLVSSAPIVTPSGSPAAATLWDRLSRQAGVVDGDDWVDRVSALGRHLEDDNARVAADELLAFVQDLDVRLRPAEPPTSWRGWANWAGDLLSSLLRVDGSWPALEVVAHEHLQSVLQRIGGLDGVDEQPSFEALATTIEAELDAARVPGRPAGQGLVVAPVLSAYGLGFERVVVVGLNEGTFPRTGRDDSLLPDQARVLAGGLLPPSSEATALDIRALSALVSASVSQPLLTSARGSLRSRRSNVWPRRLDHLVEQPMVVLESHHRGLADHGRPASLDDLGLRSLIRHVDRGDPVQTHRLASLDSVLEAGLRRQDDRHRGVLTSHSGLVPAGVVDPGTRLLSPTALEDYSSCPRRYLFSRVLRLGEDERPERIEEITARDRGTLVHLILERFVGEAIANDAVPEPEQPWSASAVDRLLELLGQSLDEAREQGITGGRVQTEVLRWELTNEALEFIETDNELRSSHRSRPVAVERRFGFEPDDPGRVDVGDGRQLLMRGVVDRIDLTDDGGLLVIDYKGGSATPFQKMNDDPLRGGTRLQLPLYARILADQLDRTGPRTALYWLTKHKQLKHLLLDEALENDLDGHITSALDGIGGGLFPGLPGTTVGWPRLTFENCKFCDFDRICPTDRQREWEGVQDDPALTPIDLLLGRSPEPTSVTVASRAEEPSQ